MERMDPGMSSVTALLAPKLLRLPTRTRLGAGTRPGSVYALKAALSLMGPPGRNLPTAVTGPAPGIPTATTLATSPWAGVVVVLVCASLLSLHAAPNVMAPHDRSVISTVTRCLFVLTSAPSLVPASWPPPQRRSIVRERVQLAFGDWHGRVATASSDRLEGTAAAGDGLRALAA